MPTPPKPSTPVVLHAPADAVLAAPLMLGYWPDNSLCAIFVDAEHRVVLIMRWDADAQAAIPALPPMLPGETVPGTVHLVAYTSSPPPGAPPAAPDRSAWRHAERTLHDSGMSLGWILVAGRHGDSVPWTCVEGQGSELDVRVIAGLQVARQAQRWGLPPWRSTRRDYIGDIATDPIALHHVVEELRKAPPAVEEAMRDAAIGAVRDRLACGDISPFAVAATLVALADVRVRDTLLWDLMQEEASTWPAIAEWMARVVAAAPETHVAAPATLLAILRWQMGDGSRASAAVERALAADPAYTLAALVDRCLTTGMHPSVWRAGLADLSREDCRRAA